MSLQNRVGADGAVVAAPQRGLLMGNRGGRLHTSERTLGRRRWTSRRWISCVLAFRGRRRTVMGPGYTELFFLDELVALAAGHRPCGECRRTALADFRAAWGGTLPLEAIDRVLHAARNGPRTVVPLAGLPDGAIVDTGLGPCVLWAGALRPVGFAGYGAAIAAPLGEVRLLTPEPIVDVLRAGYRPSVLHPSLA